MDTGLHRWVKVLIAERLLHSFWLLRSSRWTWAWSTAPTAVENKYEATYFLWVNKLEYNFYLVNGLAFLIEYYKSAIQAGAIAFSHKMVEVCRKKRLCFI